MHQAIQALQIAHPKSRVRDIVSISLGVCTLVPQNDNEPETLIALADQALYKAKDDGRDRVQSVLVQADSN
jgi:diguanylate cyclase (GGDEF)-like protein